MGVLRVNDGTALLPDWRNVGCGGAAGSGFTAITDNFNRANSSTTLGSPWTVVSEGSGGSPAWGISSNQAYCASTYIDGGGTVHSTLAYQDVGSGDVDITVTLAVANNTYGVLLRLSGTATFFFIGSTSIQWFSGGGTVVHPHSSGIASGDVMRVLAVGSSIQVFKNGTLVNSVTDTRNQTATRHGMIGDAVFAPSMRLDDFTIAPGVAATTGRLKLWDGTRWMREVCDSDIPAFPTVAGTVSIYVDTTASPHLYRIYSYGLPAATYYVHPQFNVGTGVQFNTTLASGTPSGQAIWEVLWSGTYVIPGDTVNNIRLYDSSVTQIGTATASPNAVQALPTLHPLKMWDGTTWQTVACMTPA